MRTHSTFLPQHPSTLLPPPPKHKAPCVCSEARDRRGRQEGGQRPAFWGCPLQRQSGRGDMENTATLQGKLLEVPCSSCGQHPARSWGEAHIARINPAWAPALKATALRATGIGSSQDAASGWEEAQNSCSPKGSCFCSQLTRNAKRGSCWGCGEKAGVAAPTVGSSRMQG